MNIDYLEELTDGDLALQKELIQLYMLTLEKSMAHLALSIPLDKDEEWQFHAHELKGASFSIGLEDIAALCSEAYYTDKLGEKGKQDLLNDIKHHVTDFMAMTTHLR